MDDYFRVLAGMCACTLGSGFLCGTSCINNSQKYKKTNSKKFRDVKDIK